MVLLHVCPESRTSPDALKCLNFSISSYFAFIKSLSFWFSVIMMSFVNFVVFGGNGFQWTTSKLTLDSDKSLLRTLYQCYKGISEGTTSVRIMTFFPSSIFHLFFPLHQNCLSQQHLLAYFPNYEDNQVVNAYRIHMKRMFNCIHLPL